MSCPGIVNGQLTAYVFPNTCIAANISTNPILTTNFKTCCTQNTTTLSPPSCPYTYCPLLSPSDADAFATCFNSTIAPDAKETVDWGCTMMGGTNGLCLWNETSGMSMSVTKTTWLGSGPTELPTLTGSCFGPRATSIRTIGGSGTSSSTSSATAPAVTTKASRAARGGVSFGAMGFVGLVMVGIMGQ